MITKTTNQLHFEDLDPIRFEELVLGLVYEMKPWGTIYHYGKMGSDDGIDIEAREKKDGQEVVYHFQCKRYKKITNSIIKKIIDNYCEKNSSIPDFYFLVISCHLSKRQIEYFGKCCKESGLKEAVVWTSSILEAKLYSEHQDLLEKFFGLPEIEADENTNAERMIYRERVFFILAVLILFFPFFIKYTYQETWLLPDNIAKICRSLQETNLLLYYLIGVGVIWGVFSYYFKTDINYLIKTYEKQNISQEDFLLPPNEFLRKVLLLCEGRGIVAQNKIQEQTEPTYSYRKQLKDMDIVSLDGKTVDYFYLKDNLNFFSSNKIFYLDSSMTKREITKILTIQGFDFCGIENHTLHFSKGALHILIVHRDIFVVSGIVVYRESVDPSLFWKKPTLLEEFESDQLNIEEVIKKLKLYFETFK